MAIWLFLVELLLVVTQIDSMLDKVISAVYPVLGESANMELFLLQGVLRQVPRRQIVSIVKFYTRQSHEEFSKKRFVFDLQCLLIHFK